MDRKLLKLILLRSIKLCLFVLAFSLQLSVFRNPALAGWYCEPVYGGGERCWGTGEILINKLVFNGKKGEYVDNLTLTAAPEDLYILTPGQEVSFILRVTNTGSAEFGKVTVKDTFPSYLDFVWGPLGWNPSTRILQFDVYNLKAGETRDYEVRAKVFEKGSVPTGPTCVFNYAYVEADGKSDSDQAQVCFEKKVLGVEVLPPTGAENGLFIAFGLLVTTILGAKLAFAKQTEN